MQMPNNTGGPQISPASIIPPASIRNIQSMGPSSALFGRMYASNPAFRRFADSMRGKTPEQAFRENGLDFNDFKDYRW